MKISLKPENIIVSTMKHLLHIEKSLIKINKMEKHSKVHVLIQSSIQISVNFIMPKSSNRKKSPLKSWKSCHSCNAFAKSNIKQITFELIKKVQYITPHTSWMPLWMNQLLLERSEHHVLTKIAKSRKSLYT